MLPEFPFTVDNNMKSFGQEQNDEDNYDDGNLNVKLDQNYTNHNNNNNNNNNNNYNNFNKCEQYYCQNMPCIDPLLTLPATRISTATTTTTTNITTSPSTIINSSSSNYNCMKLMNNDEISIYKQEQQTNQQDTRTCKWNQRVSLNMDCNCMNNSYNNNHNDGKNLNNKSQNASHLLLQGSDDPLISRGANSVISDDDHPVELRSLIATGLQLDNQHKKQQQLTIQQHYHKTQQQQQSSQQSNQQSNQQSTYSPTIWSSIIKQKLKDKACLMSAQAQAKAAQAAQILPKNKQIQDNANLHKQQQQQQIDSKKLSVLKNSKIKNALKLRFHHQNVPAEYLTAINEPSLSIEHRSNVDKTKLNTPRTKDIKDKRTIGHSKSYAQDNNVRSWLKNIVEIQKQSSQDKPKPSIQNPTLYNILQNQGSLETSAKHCDYIDVDELENLSRETKTAKDDIEQQRAINFTDLPFMGEITLDNSRPRRGRKPKKANICHLIYKNYGTIILGEPKIATCDNCECNNTSYKHNQSVPLCPDVSKYKVVSEKMSRPEALPLNLCLRDQSDIKETPIDHLINPINYDAIETPNETILNGLNNKSPVPTCSQKRKRSALFIPPKPADNALSPATEVSICKFKFTGGAKPLLQEKKMLSVDSDGNYRYFNGQNHNNYQHNTKSCSSSSPALPATTTSGGVVQDCHNSNRIMPALKFSNYEALEKFPQFVGQVKQPNNRHDMTKCDKIDNILERKKKISRRSEQRERLEKTFKEKGFLIQTQQLQSAEGATYCKFRQLKKFTRYLFRNWKDYLPNELQQDHNQNQPENPDERQINESVENYFKEKQIFDINNNNNNNINQRNHEETETVD